MITVGDRVRFLPSYPDIVKSDYLFEELRKEASDGDTEVKLGGEYTVRESKENKWGITMYRLLATDSEQSWIPEALVRLSTDTEPCPFHIGDELLFRPQCAPLDLGYATRAYADAGFSDSSTIFILERTINSYYIEVENSGVRHISFPFMWIDFASA